MKLLNQGAQMADVMRSEGKIYVVVAGLLIVMVGFLFYLYSLDRKITKLEKEVEGK
jgi:CcmD family protein